MYLKNSSLDLIYQIYNFSYIFMNFLIKVLKRCMRSAMYQLEPKNSEDNLPPFNF